MKRGSVSESWNSFFFTPQSPIPIALFRIVYGILVSISLILLYPDWLAWYGPDAWVSLSTMQRAEPGMRINLFTILPPDNAWITLLFWIFLLSAVLLSLGLLTRVNSVIVFVCLASIHQRNLYMTHGGDTFLRVAGFFLMFAPCGAAFSLDRLIRRWRGREGPDIQFHAPWAQRMIQIELALMYIASVCWKLQGSPWLQGTALSYVYQLDELRRFPIPSALLNPVAVRMETWLTLLVELALGLLIWVKPLRYYILALGVLLHLSLEYSLNIPMFQWEILSAYILFIDAGDLPRIFRTAPSRDAETQFVGDR